MNAVYGFTYCLLLDIRYMKYRSCHSYYFQIQLDKKCYLVKIVWLLEWKIHNAILKLFYSYWDLNFKNNLMYIGLTLKLKKRLSISSRFNICMILECY